MSSDPPSDAPSPSPEPDAGSDPGRERAAIVATLGAVLIDALEHHLPGARRHGEATGAYAFAIAVELGHGREQAELIREAARLHDIGMVYLPSATLRKPATELDDAERALLASHIEAGAKLAQGAGIPADVCEWILHTRERWDGGGPEGLDLDWIPFPARAIRVACACDLLLASGEQAAVIGALRGAAGSELDPTTVQALVAVLERVDPRAS